MNPPASLRLDRSAYRPGETVTGAVRGEPRGSVDVELLWRTQGKGGTDQQVVQRCSMNIGPTGRGTRFELRLPEGPYSFSGSLISLQWEIRLSRHGVPRGEGYVIEVGPEGHTLALPRLDPPDGKRRWWAVFEW